MPIATEIVFVEQDENGITVTASCAESDALIFCAAYSEAGQLTDFQIQSAVVGQKDYLFASDTEYPCVKVFLTDAAFRPLCEKQSFAVQ